MMNGKPDEIILRAARNSECVSQQIITNYTYGDTMIHAECGWDYHDGFPFTMQCREKMEHATAVYDKNGLNVYLENGEKLVLEFKVECNGENTEGINVSGIAGYYNENKDFVERIENNTEPSIAPLCEAIKSHEVVLKEIELAGGLVK